LVPPFSLRVSFGLKESAEQPPTWKGADTPALLPSTEVTAPVIVIGSQEVGLSVNWGRPICRVMERRSSGMPSRIWGNGSETAWIWVVVGSRCRATLTTTTPRSKGPATAGVITARERGAPS
jgi:hypothetical protein